MYANYMKTPVFYMKRCNIYMEHAVFYMRSGDIYRKTIAVTLKCTSIHTKTYCMFIIYMRSRTHVNTHLHNPKACDIYKWRHRIFDNIMPINYSTIRWHFHENTDIYIRTNVVYMRTPNICMNGAWSAVRVPILGWPWSTCKKRVSWISFSLNFVTLL